MGVVYMYVKDTRLSILAIINNKDIIKVIVMMGVVYMYVKDTRFSTLVIVNNKDIIKMNITADNVNIFCACVHQCPV